MLLVVQVFDAAQAVDHPLSETIFANFIPWKYRTVCRFLLPFSGGGGELAWEEPVGGGGGMRGGMGEAWSDLGWGIHFNRVFFLVPSSARVMKQGFPLCLWEHVLGIG